MAYDVGLADRIRSILRRRATEREMFGGLAFMVNGHMCCGIVKSDLMLRLTPEAVTAALSRPHTRPMDFTGKPMKSMIFVSAEGCDTGDALRDWVQASEAFVRSLPPKTMRSEKRKRNPSNAA